MKRSQIQQMLLDADARLAAKTPPQRNTSRWHERLRYKDVDGDDDAALHEDGADVFDDGDDDYDDYDDDT
ncbi:MAG: hypothetical protein LBR73_01780 [Oscillospiraceae bacterium]|nr:hypothetical protein [Oscillospiraceae bacterium]